MIYDFKASGNYFKLDFDIQLIKDQQVYCFIGENGAGKTKLLQTLAKIFICNNAIFDITKFDGKVYSNLANNSYFIEKVSELIVTLPDEVMVNQNILKSRAHVNFPKYGAIKLSTQDIINSRLNTHFSIDKPIIFVSAKGRGYISGLGNNNSIDLPNSHINNFIDSLIYTYNSIHDGITESDSIGVTKWLLQRLVMDANFIQNVQKLRDDAVYVLELLNKFWPQFDLVAKSNNQTILKIDWNDGDLLLSGIPIQELSTGFASILRIVQEIVSGLRGWNDIVDLHTADGIVFIDEIDLHLHPKWQFKIIDLLKEFFPKVTFYITTHSPLVLFNLKNGEGYKLHKDDNNLVTAQPVEQNNMQFVGDVIKQFFDVDGVSIRKNDKQAMMQARKNLLDLIAENQDEQ